jgi:hypothetical protein
VDLPPTLHGQHYPLDYERHRHRFAGNDLRVFDRRDTHRPSPERPSHRPRRQGPPGPSCTPHGPAALGPLRPDHSRRTQRLGRADLRHQNYVRQGVRRQLTDGGWLRVQRREGSIRRRPEDEQTIDRTAGHATAALRNALAGLPADPRPLAVGLLAVLGQLRTLRSVTNDARTPDADSATSPWRPSGQSCCCAR